MSLEVQIVEKFLEASLVQNSCTPPLAHAHIWEIH